jgi:spore cortex biosynthesis protein YabQ
MDQPILLDSVLFLHSAVLGFLLGLYYEVFRFLRLAFPHKSILVALEDLAFWIPTTAVFLLFTFAFSDGILRWFSFAGALIGFLLYRYSLGRLLFFFAKQILDTVKGIFRFFYQKTVLPLVIVFKNITNWLCSVIKRIGIIARKHWEQKQLQRDKKAAVAFARRGFLGIHKE